MENNNTIDMQSGNLESSAGYRLAMSFKPFISAGCTEHMEIVKDMAKSINSVIHSAENNGNIFNKGYEEGKNWQQQKDKAVIETAIQFLKDSVSVLEFVINATETGTNRDHLTDVNIWIQSAINQLK